MLGFLKVHTILYKVVELGPNTNITTVDKYPIKND
jgi:hypothetical protein